MDKKDVRDKLEQPLETESLLKSHEFKQEGRVLICVDDPSLTAILPLGVYLFGKKGAYRLEKLF